MKIRKLLQGLVAVSALCVGATSLHAQGISVFAMGSVSSLYNGKSYLEHSVPYESNYKTGGGITLGAEWRLNRILGVEGAYSRVRNNLTLTNVGASPAVESGYGIHDQRFSADLVAHAPTSFLGLKPYWREDPSMTIFPRPVLLPTFSVASPTPRWAPPINWASITAAGWIGVSCLTSLCEWMCETT